MSEKYLFLYADAYGFKSNIKSMVYNVELFQRISKNLEGFNKAINSRIDSKNNEKLCITKYQFSDSIFLAAKVPEECTTACVEDFITLCGELYEESIKFELPLRGCITYGDLLISDGFILGTPVIQSVAVESQLHLPAIFLPSFTVREIQKDFGEHSLSLKNPIDLEVESGVIRGYPIIPTQASSIREKAEEYYEKLVVTFGKGRPASGWRKLINLLPKDGDVE